MRRPAANPHMKSARHTLRLDFVLEFAEPAAFARAEQAARRLMEAIQVSLPDTPDQLKSAKMICHETRHVITLLSAGQEGGPGAD